MRDAGSALEPGFDDAAQVQDVLGAGAPAVCALPLEVREALAQGPVLEFHAVCWRSDSWSGYATEGQTHMSMMRLRRNPLSGDSTPSQS